MVIKTTLPYLGEIPTIYLGPNTPSFYIQLENACIKVLDGAYPPDFSNKGLLLQGIDDYGTCTWAPRVACGGEQKRFPFFRWVDLEAAEDRLQMEVTVPKTEDGVPNVKPKTEKKSGKQTAKKIKVKKKKSPDRQTRYDLRPRSRKF